ncbi:hypothetical protein LguiA_025759 [Lonicera macranthoides]
MAELNGNKKGLTINLNSLSCDDQNSSKSSSITTTKSPKNFEEPIGLGIVAAMNESDQSNDQNFNSSAKSCRGPILSVSPRTNPIPILSNLISPNSAKPGPNLGSNSSAESEEYTCVISHIGNNLIKKREYFDGDLDNGSEKITTFISAPARFSGDSPENSLEKEFEPADFLSSCFLCEKMLHGLDIFMYRGEKAFCSAECRHKQISSDERREKKRNSGVNNKKPIKYSVSPCSDQLQFFAGVAAA